MAEPVGVENSHLGYSAEAVGPVGQDVGISASQRQRVAVPGVNSTDGAGGCLPAEASVCSAHRSRTRKETRQRLGHGDRACPWPASAMRNCKRLVEIEVH